MIPQKETAGCEPAGLEVSVHSDFASKIVNGQARNGYALEVLIPGTDQEESRKLYVGSSDAARSYLLIAQSPNGVTRAEALKNFFILSLTQHVHQIRKHCKFWDVIDTVRVGPKRYARYHLPKDITIRLFKIGGQ